MLIIDVNVLLYAHRQESVRHKDYFQWLETLGGSDRSFTLPAPVRSGFIRIATNPRVYKTPTFVDQAFQFIEHLLACPNYLEVGPGEHHWELFRGLCRKAGAKGNLVSDAYLAALALETGGEMVSTDRGFARFPGLRWSHPLDGKS